MVGRFIILVFFWIGASLVVAQDNIPSPDYFVEAIVDNPTPYIGQQTWYRVRLYDAIGLENPQYVPPDFEGLWRADGEFTQRYVQDIAGRQYTVTEVVTAVFPTQMGEVLVPAAKIILPETVHRPQEELTTETVTVHAQPLPPNTSSDFTGGVGRFEMFASLDRQSVVLGEPLTLRLVLRGTGNIEQLLLPVIAFPTNWRSIGEVSTFQSAWVNGEVLGEKVYEYSLMPTEIGSYTLAAINFSFFDVDNNQYRSISTSPVTLEVLSDNSGLNATGSESSAEVVTVLPLKVIYPAAPAGELFPEILLGMLWLLPPTICIGIWGWRHYKNRRQRLDQQSAAFLHAMRQLQLVSHSLSQDVPLGVERVIISYLSQKTAAPLGGMPIDEIKHLLGAVKLPESLVIQTIACLYQAEENRYSPQPSNENKALVKQARQALQSLDHVWK